MVIAARFQNSAGVSAWPTFLACSHQWGRDGRGCSLASPEGAQRQASGEGRKEGNVWQHINPQWKDRSQHDYLSFQRHFSHLANVTISPPVTAASPLRQSYDVTPLRPFVSPLKAVSPPPRHPYTFSPFPSAASPPRQSCTSFPPLSLLSQQHLHLPNARLFSL